MTGGAIRGEVARAGDFSGADRGAQVRTTAGDVAKGRKPMTTTMICILLSTACGVTGQLVLKKGMTAIGVLTPSAGAVPSIVWRLATSPLVLAGLTCYALGSFFWLIALSRVELSFAYPFLSLGFILVFVASWFFFGEAITIPRLAGMISICVGLLFIARS